VGSRAAYGGIIRLYGYAGSVLAGFNNSKVTEKKAASWVGHFSQHRSMDDTSWVGPHGFIYIGTKTCRYLTVRV
jgi:hypothetical protein